MKKSRITTALLAIGISASMVFQTPVFATEETAVAVSSGITTNGISGWPQGPDDHFRIPCRRLDQSQTRPLR